MLAHRNKVGSLYGCSIFEKGMYIFLLLGIYLFRVDPIHIPIETCQIKCNSLAIKTNRGKRRELQAAPHPIPFQYCFSVRTTSWLTPYPDRSHRQQWACHCPSSPIPWGEFHQTHQP